MWLLKKVCVCERERNKDRERDSAWVIEVVKERVYFWLSVSVCVCKFDASVVKRECVCISEFACE